MSLEHHLCVMQSEGKIVSYPGGGVCLILYQPALVTVFFPDHRLEDTQGGLEGGIQYSFYFLVCQCACVLM